MMKQTKAAIENYGIYGNVSSEVVAVGSRAVANKTSSVTEAGHMKEAIKELKSALDDRKIPSSVRSELESVLSDLDNEAKRPQPRKKQVVSSLKRLSLTIKSIGDIASDLSKIILPIKKIAGAVGVALSLVGLSQ